MPNNQTLESLDYFVENGKALYEYTYEEKPEIELQNRRVLEEREDFAQLPRWAQDYFLRNVIHSELKERVRWLSDAVSSKCTFDIKHSIKKKNNFIDSLNNEYLRIERAGNNQLHLRQEYAKYLAGKLTKSPVKNICQNCKSLDTRKADKEPYETTERYVSHYDTSYERRYLYTDEYGIARYTEDEKKTPVYSTRDVIRYRTIHVCSVCNSRDFKNSNGRTLPSGETFFSNLISGIKLILAFLAFLVFFFLLVTWFF